MLRAKGTRQAPLRSLPVDVEVRDGRTFAMAALICVMRSCTASLSRERVSFSSLSGVDAILLSMYWKKLLSKNGMLRSMILGISSGLEKASSVVVQMLHPQQA